MCLGQAFALVTLRTYISALCKVVEGRRLYLVDLTDKEVPAPQPNKNERTRSLPNHSVRVRVGKTSADDVYG